MASGNHRSPRKGKAMAKFLQRPWSAQFEDDLSDTDSVLSTEAIKSRSEPATDDEQEDDEEDDDFDEGPPEGCVEIGQQPNQLEPPTEADMEEMKIIASSSTTDEILTKMHGRAERRSVIIETMEALRADVQQQFDGAVNALINDYVQTYFKPAVQRLHTNYGDSDNIDRDILDKISCDLLDNAKLQFNAIRVRARSPAPLPVLRDPDAMPSLDSLGPLDFNQMPSWLPADSVPLAASPSWDGFRMTSPTDLMQWDREYFQDAQGDVVMQEPPDAGLNDGGVAGAGGGGKTLPSWSAWRFEGWQSPRPMDERPVKRSAVKRAYCSREEGDEADGDDDDDDEPDGKGSGGETCVGPAKKSCWKYGSVTTNLLRSLMSLLYHNRMFWNGEVITTTTRFLTNLQAALVFGAPLPEADDEGDHFLGKHSDLIRYRPDLEDCDWLLRHKLIEEPVDRVLILVYDEVAYVQQRDSRYRLKSNIDLASVQTFCLPQFIIAKVRKFFSTLNFASRGCITFEKPAADELAKILRRCLPLVPARYSAFANWAIAAAATERDCRPSPEMLSMFKASFAAVAAMVKSRQLAERRHMEALALAAENGGVASDGENEQEPSGGEEEGEEKGEEGGEEEGEEEGEAGDEGVMSFEIDDENDVYGDDVDGEDFDGEDVDVNDVGVEDVDVNDVEDVDLKDVDLNDVDVNDVEDVDVNDVEDVDFNDVDLNDFDVLDFDVNDLDVEDFDVKDDYDFDLNDVEDVDLNEVDLNDVEEANVSDADVGDFDMEDVDFAGDDDGASSSVATYSDEDGDYDEASEVSGGCESYSPISASDTASPALLMPEEGKKPSGQLTTAEILLKIPATITVTTRGSPLYNEVAAQPGFSNRPAFTQDDRKTGVNDELLMPFVVTPELTIFRRGRASTNGGASSLLILGGGN